MKKITLFFVIFVLSGVLAAQEAQNGPVSAPTDEKAAAEEAVPAGDAQSEEAAKPAEEPQQAEEKKSEPEAETEPQEVETVPEIEHQPAEEVSKENVTAAPAEEAEEEPARPQQTSSGCPEVCEAPKEGKPSKMFYQPSLGIGLGASIFSLRINNDIDFLLKHTKDGTNVYMGLEIDFRYSPYLDDHSIYEIPIQINMAVDFPLIHKNIKRLALWFSAGVDLAIGYLFYYDYDDDDWDDKKDRETMFKVMPAWGLGVTMLFRNDVTLKLGFDSFYGKYPDIICAAGYRF